MSAPFILALDIASQMGVCEGRAGDIPRCYTQQIAGPQDSVIKAMDRARRWLVERLRVDRPDYFIVERRIPTFNKGKVDDETGEWKPTTSPRAMKLQIGLSLELCSIAYAKGLASVPHNRIDEEYSVAPSTVRAAFIGNGKLPRDDAKRRTKAMARLLGWNVKNDDEADAAAAWWWASTIVAPRHYTPVTPMMQAKIASMFDAPQAYRGGRT